MTFDQLLNQTITVKRKSETGRGELNQPIIQFSVVSENVKCTMKRATAKAKTFVWGESTEVDYEARMVSSEDIREHDRVEWGSLTLEVTAVLEDSRFHHKRVALKVVEHG